MITIYTHQGKRIKLTLERELRSPVEHGEYVRAYCHIHGSDHQRSLSINRATGWGHCFNAVCGATVLVAEWNSAIANRLLSGLYQDTNSSALTRPRPRPVFVQPMLLPPQRHIPGWQQEEDEALHSLDRLMRQALLSTPRARSYLRERGIPLAVAKTTGTGYLPLTLLREPGMREHRKLLYRWTDRVLFPLTSPEGGGYIGRTLWHWQPGMTEAVHKRVLEREDGPRRWIKTNPAGWFGMNDEQLSHTVILVEGAFDRLTLLAAGFQASEIIALAGTAAHADWFPTQVKKVVLALDADEGGREASARLSEQLSQAGMTVKVCHTTQETWGKDWNERWRQTGLRSVAPVAHMLSQTRSA